MARQNPLSLLVADEEVPTGDPSLTSQRWHVSRQCGRGSGLSSKQNGAIRDVNLPTKDPSARSHRLQRGAWAVVHQRTTWVSLHHWHRIVGLQTSLKDAERTYTPEN